MEKIECVGVGLEKEIIVAKLGVSRLSKKAEVEREGE